MRASRGAVLGMIFLQPTWGNELDSPNLDPEIWPSQLTWTLGVLPFKLQRPGRPIGGIEVHSSCRPCTRPSS